MSRKMIDYKVENGTITSIDGYEVGGGGTAVEANPQEEATQQLEKIKIDNIAYNIAGGGSGGSVITNYERKSKTGSIAQLSSNTYDGYSMLEPNTSYNIGDCFAFTFSSNFESETLLDNQIIVPISAMITPEHFISSLTIGDVVLALTGWSAGPQYLKSDNKTYTIRSFNYVYFTVVKAGTTGANIPALPRAPKITIEYAIYTLGESTAK